MHLLDTFPETVSSQPRLPGLSAQSDEPQTWTEPSVIQSLAKAIIADLPTDALVSGLQFLEQMKEVPEIRVGSICSGSDMGHSAIVALLECYQGPMPVVRHTMCVEWVAWKRDWIMCHYSPDTLFGDVKDFAKDSAMDYVSNTLKPHPAVDIVTIGFSCKCFSPLNNKTKDFTRAVLEGKGSSGVTATSSLIYVERHKPKVVLIENVTGLLNGYQRADSLTLEVAIDTCSNLAVLLDALRRMGYVCPFAKVNPAPRMAVNRARAWLPCVHRPDLADNPDAIEAMELVGRTLLTELTGHCDTCIPMERIKMEPESKDFDLWCAKANGSGSEPMQNHSQGISSGKDHLYPHRRSYKWRHLHAKMFEKAGLVYPPSLTEKMQKLALEAGLTDREAEILHYSDLVAPIEHCLEHDMLIDLGQSLGRCRESTRKVPCVTPGSRLWWRRAERWLLAPEAVRAQGYDPTDEMMQFTHRQVLDLMGNAFNSSCLMASLAVALALLGDM
jgi:site-specific DNA-cytosine methylase